MRIEHINSQNINVALNNFNAVVKDNENFIYNIIHTIHGDIIMYYDDLYSIAITTLWQCLQKYNGKKQIKFSTYAYNSIKNNLIRFVKEELSHNVYSIDDYYHLQTPYSYEEQIIKNIDYENIYNQFTELEIKIMKLRAQNYTLKEIAKQLNKNYYTIKDIYYRLINSKFKMLYEYETI